MKDVLADLPGYSLRRASAAMLAKFSALLTPLRLRPTEASLLILIDVNPGMTPSALGQLLAVQRANMVPLVTRLEESGCIDRVPLDGRSFGLTLTLAGTKICSKVKQAIEIHEREIMERIPEAHREHLAPALKALWRS